MNPNNAAYAASRGGSSAQDRPTGGPTGGGKHGRWSILLTWESFHSMNNFITNLASLPPKILNGDCSSCSTYRVPCTFRICSLGDGYPLLHLSHCDRRWSRFVFSLRSSWLSRTIPLVNGGEYKTSTNYRTWHIVASKCKLFFLPSSLSLPTPRRSTTCSYICKWHWLLSRDW